MGKINKRHTYTLHLIACFCFPCDRRIRVNQKYIPLIFFKLQQDVPAEDAAATGDAPTKTIADMVAENEDFSLLLTAVTAADEGAEEGMALLPVLGGSEKMVIVFAPNNAAIEASLAELGITADDLLSDKDRLRGIIQYHVVGDDGDESSMEKAVMAGDLSDGMEIDTLNEDAPPLVVSIKDDKVMLNDKVTVETPDLKASNGVIHVIDMVLVPEGVEITAAAPADAEDGEEDG